VRGSEKFSLRFKQYPRKMYWGVE